MLGYNMCALINSLLHGQRKAGQKIICATVKTFNGGVLLFCVHAGKNEFNLAISENASYKEALNVVRNFID